MQLRNIVFAACIVTIPCFACDNKDPAPADPNAASSGASSASGNATNSAASNASTAQNDASSKVAPVMASASASASTGAVTTADSALPSDGGIACGMKANPCPLQAWMQKNANTAIQSGDAAKVGLALEQTAALAPSGYPNWQQISNDGAAAGKSGDFVAAKAACRTCHDQYKAKYKTEMRDRKI